MAKNNKSPLFQHPPSQSPIAPAPLKAFYHARPHYASSARRLPRPRPTGAASPGFCAVLVEVASLPSFWSERAVAAVALGAAAILVVVVVAVVAGARRGGATAAGIVVVVVDVDADAGTAAAADFAANSSAAFLARSCLALVILPNTVSTFFSHTERRPVQLRCIDGSRSKISEAVAASILFPVTSPLWYSVSTVFTCNARQRNLSRARRSS